MSSIPTPDLFDNNDDSNRGSEKAKPHHFDTVEWGAFREHIQTDKENRVGAEHIFDCNVDPKFDHLMLRRVGEKGARLNARGQIVCASTNGGTTVLSTYFTAAELRQIAATALNIADEIDGETPLFVLSKGGTDSP